MALVYADRVKETSTTTGTGTYSLAGAATGFRTFVAGIATGNTCYYCATDGTNWEVGLGTVTDATPDTLARTTILASSNAGSAVDWGAGTRDIFCTIPAIQAGKVFPHRTILTSGTSYTVPAGCYAIEVEVVGGGGGGGSAISTTSRGLGGGGGGYAKKLYQVTPGQSCTYAIGAAGAASGDGGATTFTDGTTLITGNGGIQGQDSISTAGTASTGIGGTGTNGDVNKSGDTGGGFDQISYGGDSMLGVGGLAPGSDTAGNVGTGYGSGGSGGRASSVTDRLGAVGTTGAVIITEYY